MIKRAPTPGRLAVILLFALSCTALLVFLWVSFGGPTPLASKGYRVKVDFPEAVQLAEQADVRIAGVDVGKVVHVAPAPNGSRMRATLQIQQHYAPIPRDARAVLRLKSLLGETYVELSSGNRSAGALPDGALLPDSSVANTVQLDEVMSSFPPRTRKAFRVWMQSQAAGVKGRGADINAAFGNLPGFINQSNKLLGTLNAQSAAVRQAISGVGTFFRELSDRQGQLAGLIHDTNIVFHTTAQRNKDFAEVFKQFPRFERESSLTLPALTKFGNAADPVVRQLEPVASAMTPVFENLKKLSPQFNALFHRIGPVVRASKRGLPAFNVILQKLPQLLDDFQPWLRNINPIISYIGAHKRDVTALVGNLTAASGARDNSLTLRKGVDHVNYIRTSQILSPESLAFYPRQLGLSRNNAYPAPNWQKRLASGLSVFNSASCSNGNPAQPTASYPPQIARYNWIQKYAYRTTGRDVAAPPCKQQGKQPGFSTAFPQLKAEAP